MGNIIDKQIVKYKKMMIKKVSIYMSKIYTSSK